MASTKSPLGVKTKAVIYTGFTGLDTSVDETAQDNPESQPLQVINNAYCDWRGQIVRDPAGELKLQSGNVTHVRFYSTEQDDTEVVFAVDNGAFVSLLSNNPDHFVEDVYPSGSVITSTVFAGRVHLCSQQGYLYDYDGFVFRETTSTSMRLLSPQYICAVNRRLCVAGLLGRPTEVHLSRIDDFSIFPEEESENTPNVLTAGFIDVGNLLGTADEIKGIASFESNRLAIFTSARTLIYVIDPDINNWTIDENANINIGTISHNTIKQAGTDLIFCSERGVHTIQRSRDNGIMVYADILSKPVDLVYRALLRQVANKEEISAVWDQETNRYHIFFPIGPTTAKRLTLTMTGAEQNPNSWSTGDYVNARCGDIIAGRLVFGCNGGVYEIFDIESDEDELSNVAMEIETPILWQGSMTQDKQAHSFFIHASGKADLLIEINDEHDRPITSFNLEIDDDDDGILNGKPIIRQYERKFETRYRGAKVRITSTGKGLVRISALGFFVR